MELSLRMPGPTPDLAAIQRAVHAVDAAALVDIDPDGHTLRVAGTLHPAQLVTLLNDAGCHVTLDQVAQAPSTCCGSCSG